MQTWKGRFDQRGSACLDFAVCRQGQDNVLFSGLIDTGFSGFVQIPMQAGIVHGLIAAPIVTGRTMLANGSIQEILICRLSVMVEGESGEGLCQLAPSDSSPVLVGMEFLRHFGRALLISTTHGVLLPRERDLADIARPDPAPPPA